MVNKFRDDYHSYTTVDNLYKGEYFPIKITRNLFQFNHKKMDAIQAVIITLLNRTKKQ